MINLELEHESFEERNLSYLNGLENIDFEIDSDS